MPTTVAIVASEGFSTFHFSVPLILFGENPGEPQRFTRYICAEQPGLLWSKEGTAVQATHDFTTLAQCEIVIVPFWRRVDEKPSPALLAALQQRVKTAQRWLVFVWGLLHWPTPVYSTTGAPPRTGNMKKRSSACFLISISTLTSYTPRMMESSPLRAPLRRWTAVCTSSASALAQT